MSKIDAQSLTFQEVPMPKSSFWTIRIAVIGVAFLILWASIAKIDQVTRATAVIIPSLRPQMIQAADGGVLTKLHVKEGEVVSTGQILATFERDKAQSAVDDSEAKVAALEAAVLRLTAETLGMPLVFPPKIEKEHADYVKNQIALYNRRKNAIEQEVASLRKMVQLARQELQMTEKLENTGDVSLADILKLRRNVSDLEAQITNKQNKYFQDAQAELTKAREELNTQKESLREREQFLGHTELLAPVNGNVTNVRVTTIGGVVKPGDVVLELLPLDDSLLVEAKVSPADIAFIKTGQAANVKLDAFDYSIFGTMTGEVTYISADTLTEETRQGPRPYYRVLVKIKGSDYKGKRSQDIRVIPGMTASVDIKAMDRTVLSYLTKPLTKTLGDSMGER